MARSADAVVIGSGHNGLVAAAYLARAGWEVAVFERNATLGGAVATEELTVPGFLHDTFSGWHPLFAGSATYAELGEELQRRGLRYLNTDVPAASAWGEGEAVVAHRDPEKTAEGFSPADRDAYPAELTSFGRAAEPIGELFAGELWSPRAVRLAARAVRRLGTRGALGLLRDVTSTARGWLASWAEGAEPERLWAPWTLHTGLSPDDAGSGFSLRALAGGLHAGGMPLPEGGAGRFVDAFCRLIEDHGGRLHAHTDVTRILVRNGRATGVVAGGEEVRARRAVVANVTPTQLYGRLLPDGVAPDAARQARRYRYGRACMQIHVALSEPLRWRDERLRRVPIVHLTDGLDSVALACAQASAGLLPAMPTVCCGQPVALDPTRAPEGRSILWIQLLEVPSRPRGDAAGQIDVDDGRWAPAVVDAYRDRVLGIIAVQAPNLLDAVLGTAVLSPPDLEARNINLVGGDPYAGATTLDQSYLWRPLPGYGSHATPVEGLFLCGASTHPGPGLNAASGRLVARRLLRSPGLRAVRSGR
jgi:phytoene dehydrogenase-like protein